MSPKSAPRQSVALKLVQRIVDTLLSGRDDFSTNELEDFKSALELIQADTQKRLDAKLNRKSRDLHQQHRLPSRRIQVDATRALQPEFSIIEHNQTSLDPTASPPPRYGDIGTTLPPSDDITESKSPNELSTTSHASSRIHDSCIDQQDFNLNDNADYPLALTMLSAGDDENVILPLEEEEQEEIETETDNDHENEEREEGEGPVSEFLRHPGRCLRPHTDDSCQAANMSAVAIRTSELDISCEEMDVETTSIEMVDSPDASQIDVLDTLDKVLESTSTLDESELAMTMSNDFAALFNMEDKTFTNQDCDNMFSLPDASSSVLHLPSNGTDYAYAESETFENIFDSIIPCSTNTTLSDAPQSIVDPLDDIESKSLLKSHPASAKNIALGLLHLSNSDVDNESSANSSSLTAEESWVYEPSEENYSVFVDQITHTDTAKLPKLNIDQTRYPTPSERAENKAIEKCIDFACRFGFRLPHRPQQALSESEIKDLLDPLARGTELSTGLLRCLLYIIFPCLSDIPELHWEDLESNCPPAQSDGHPLFALIVLDETEPLIIIGSHVSKQLNVLLYGSEECFPHDVLTHLQEWDVRFIDTSALSSAIGHTYTCIWIANSISQQRPLDDIPSLNSMRMAYIEELLKPFEQQALLEKIGINHDGERINRIGHSQVPVGETASVTSSVGLVTSPEGFDPSLFSKCLSQVPKELNQQRWFKILQYVSAIGSPAILRSITLAFSELHKKLTMDPEDDRIFEKLFRIHLYLERHDGRGHIDNARERYIKYCYYEAYELAVAALQEAKGRAYRERRKVSAVRMTATWKQGMRENLPSTPNSDEVDRVYSYFNPEERKVRAMDMVKLEVSRSIVREHGGNEVDIRKDITRFVKEGKVLHTVLYGARCLNPKLFILFPSQDSHRPVLQPHDLGMILGKKERQPYGRPFTLRFVEGLTLVEARWFATLLQARNNLESSLPIGALDLLSGST